MKFINKESVILSEIYSNMAVELDCRDTPIDKALQAIVKVTKDFDEIPDPREILPLLVRDYDDIVIKDDILCFIIDSDDESNNEGGEIMNYETKYTSGEEKVAIAVIRKFGEGFKIKNPSRMVFEDCLETSFPKIGKNSHQATQKLIRGGYLQEKEGKIFLGEKGKKILSL